MRAGARVKSFSRKETEISLNLKECAVKGGGRQRSMLAVYLEKLDIEREALELLDQYTE